MSLRDNVHRLARQHMTTTPKGYTKAEPLLDQLDAAIRPDKGGGKSGGSGRGDIINMSALKLWERICGDIDVHSREHGLTVYRDRKQTILQWENLDDGDQFFEHATLDWCDAIDAMLSPIKPWHPDGRCPACHQRYYLDDEDTRKPVFSVHYLGPDGHPLHPDQWRVECGGCSAEWTGTRVKQVAYRIASGL